MPSWSDDRVYTGMNADEVTVGSKVWIGNTPNELGMAHAVHGTGGKGEGEHTLTAILNEQHEQRFVATDDATGQEDTYAFVFVLKKAESREYRAFENATEFMEALEKQKLPFLLDAAYKTLNDSFSSILKIHDTGIYVVGPIAICDGAFTAKFIEWSLLLKIYKFYDRTPCGVRIKETKE